VNSEIDGLLEDHPINASTSSERPLSNGTTAANDEMMGGSVNAIYLITPMDDLSTSRSNSPPKDDMPDLASSLSNEIRAQSHPSVVDFGTECLLLSGSNILQNLDAESSVVTSSTTTKMPLQTCLRSTTTQQRGRENSGLFNMQGDTVQTCIEDNHPQRERTRNLDMDPISRRSSEPSKGDWRASDDDSLSLTNCNQLFNLETNELSHTQEPGSGFQLNALPSLPTNWEQMFNLKTNELSFPEEPGSGFQMNDPALLGLLTNCDQLFNLETNELSHTQEPGSDLQLNALPSLPTNWEQMFNLETNSFSPSEEPGSGLQLNALPSLPTNWEQMFNLETNSFSLSEEPRSGLQLNNPDPPLPSTHWTYSPFTFMESFNQHWKQLQPLFSPRSPVASKSFHQNTSYYRGGSIRIK
jgi:hypothetical protein